MFLLTTLPEILARARPRCASQSCLFTTTRSQASNPMTKGNSSRPDTHEQRSAITRIVTQMFMRLTDKTLAGKTIFRNRKRPIGRRKTFLCLYRIRTGTAFSRVNWPVLIWPPPKVSGAGTKAPSVRPRGLMMYTR